MPQAKDLDLTGLDIPAEDLAELLKVDVAAFKGEFEDLDSYMAGIGDKLPKRMTDQVAAYKQRLG